MSPDGSPDETVPSAQDMDWLPPEINTSVAHPARVYDYMLGGKDNFAADRALADAVTAAMPSAPFMTRANRAFLGRAIRYLVKEAGIRQFLDIGTGIPAAGNTHAVTRRLAGLPRSGTLRSFPVRRLDLLTVSGRTNGAC